MISSLYVRLQVSGPISSTVLWTLSSTLALSFPPGRYLFSGLQEAIRFSSQLTSRRLVLVRVPSFRFARSAALLPGGIRGMSFIRFFAHVSWNLVSSRISVALVLSLGRFYPSLAKFFASRLFRFAHTIGPIGFRVFRLVTDLSLPPAVTVSPGSRPSNSPCTYSPSFHYLCSVASWFLDRLV